MEREVTSSVFQQTWACLRHQWFFVSEGHTQKRHVKKKTTLSLRNQLPYQDTKQPKCMAERNACQKREAVNMDTHTTTDSC